jgi:membrane peptidoglycan carboxypeptidase
MQARRQPGSTFKPFVYLAAFEAFFEDPALPPNTPATVVEDAPALFFRGQGVHPENYEDKYFGYVTLRTALAHSLNVATVKVAEMVGYDRVANLWSKQLGIGAPIKPYPAMALGAFEATPYEIATAYNILANGGLKIEPLTVLSVTDEEGKTLEQHDPKPPERVVHEASAYLVTSMLRSVINEHGAAARAWDSRRTPRARIYDRDLRDAWFAGYTRPLCVVWWASTTTPHRLCGSRVALLIGGVHGCPAGVLLALPGAGGTHVSDIDRESARSPAPHERSLEAFIAGTSPTTTGRYTSATRWTEHGVHRRLSRRRVDTGAALRRAPRLFSAPWRQRNQPGELALRALLQVGERLPRTRATAGCSIPPGAPRST